jgi:hypothetical protein
MQITGIIKGMSKLVQVLTVTFCSFMVSFHGWGYIDSPNLPQKGVMTQDNNSQIDENINYAQFTGRVTDRDNAGKIIKVKVENNNIKFFRTGDRVNFRILNSKLVRKCRGYVRSIEDFYFVMFVDDLNYCRGTKEYFRRGTIITMNSEVLAQRVYEASKFREMLLLKKDDFLKQLNGINNELHNFDEKYVMVAAEFDRQMTAIQKEKRLALDKLVQERKQKVKLQASLMGELNNLDQNLKYYRVERQELLMDRWSMDQDTGAPVGNRPQKLIER